MMREKESLPHLLRYKILIAWTELPIATATEQGYESIVQILAAHMDPLATSHAEE